MNDTISADEFARRLPCSRTVAYDLFAHGAIRGFKVGRRVLIYASEVGRYRRCRNNAPAKRPKAKGERTEPLPLHHLPLPD
jgi:excisionase family DNA binding protein